jgi:ubiquinone/menaquinone biosynthesis C-methylase UbiE
MSCVGTEGSRGLKIEASGTQRGSPRDDVAVTGLLARITEQPREVLDTIAQSMNVRASEPAMKAICARYLARIALPEGARILEVGCGNGAATKLIMQQVGPAQLVGIDPSSAFIDMADETFAGEPRVSFAIGDAAATGQADACFDLVIAHTVYSHLVDPERALAEARRVLRPGGQLVIFDGDFATLTVALFDGDPLQAAVGAVLRNLVHRTLHHAAPSRSRHRSGVQRAIGRAPRLRADVEPGLPADVALARHSGGRPGWRDQSGSG